MFQNTNKQPVPHADIRTVTKYDRIYVISIIPVIISYQEYFVSLTDMFYRLHLNFVTSILSCKSNIRLIPPLFYLYYVEFNISLLLIILNKQNHIFEIRLSKIFTALLAISQYTVDRT